MGALRYAAITGMFELLWATRLTALLRVTSRARGLIFTLHRVLPDDPADFSPNSILQVKPEFLDFAIQRIRQLGYEIVDLGEGMRRLESEFPEKRFCVFTFDDAYRDNLKYALPILRKHQCPFTLYVPTPTSSADRRMISLAPARDQYLQWGPLDTLASMTGGTSLRAEVGAEAAFERLARELAGYYRIGVE